MNSPFKSGADYWRESSEPSRLSMDGTDSPALPALAPVGRLFDFRAGAGPGGASAESMKSSLPPMPEWLYRRPHLTGEDLLKVFLQSLTDALGLTVIPVTAIDILTVASHGTTPKSRRTNLPDDFQA